MSKLDLAVNRSKSVRKEIKEGEKYTKSHIFPDSEFSGSIRGLFLSEHAMVLQKIMCEEPGAVEYSWRLKDDLFLSMYETKNDLKDEDEKIFCAIRDQNRHVEIVALKVSTVWRVDKIVYIDREKKTIHDVNIGTSVGGFYDEIIPLMEDAISINKFKQFNSEILTN